MVFAGAFVTGGRMVRQRCHFGVLLVVGLLCATAHGLEIIPIFTGRGRLQWTEQEKAVVRQAIADYEHAILEDVTIKVEFKFFRGKAEGQAMWYTAGTPPDGTKVRPWTKQLRHGVIIHVSIRKRLWFDPTPETDGDVPSGAYDALTLYRHELGHLMGHRDAYCIDNWATREWSDPWKARIDKHGVFDPDGLKVPMYPGSFGHTRKRGLMFPVMMPGKRWDIDETVAMLKLAYGYRTRSAEVAVASALSPPAGLVAISGGPAGTWAAGPTGIPAIIGALIVLVALAGAALITLARETRGALATCRGRPTG